VGDLSRAAAQAVPAAEAAHVTAVRVCAEEVQLVALSNRTILVEGPLRLNLDALASVDIVRDGVATRLRGRVIRCAVKSLSPKGPRYELAVEFDTPIEAGPRGPRGFDLVGMDLGDPDPSLAANGW
jgi:hypothetical protein